MAAESRIPGSGALSERVQKFIRESGNFNIVSHIHACNLHSEYYDDFTNIDIGDIELKFATLHDETEVVVLVDENDVTEFGCLTTTKSLQELRNMVSNEYENSEQYE